RISINQILIKCLLQLNYMKLLLDENLPKKLKLDFSEFEIMTVVEMGWAGQTNGELLKLMIDNEFDALLTFDKNLQHQQNFKKYTLTVFVIGATNNTYNSIQPLVHLIKEHIRSKLIPGPIEIKYS
ncbi:MAG: DUF5615 family PIN-like protein, partial [Bacteroidia bacterium]